MDLIAINAANHCRLTDKAGYYECEIDFADAEIGIVRTNLNSNSEEDTRAWVLCAK